ncbi:MAG TPA: tetratricopeptide repeat protein [Candidatus Udaeobacter sp.]|nr:tetratricopeptide repeat protein [Candidatus Udaeobacter sp.]
MSASLALLLAAASVRLGHSEPRFTSAETAAEVTFNRDIAPIVYKYCAPCHRAGEAGPFPLLTYEDTAKFARQIAVITERRIMPPWLPEPGELKFAGELRLSDEQIGIFKRWAEEGAPQGEAKDLPLRPQFTPGWQLGKPDLVLHAKKAYTLAASGTDDYWNFIFPTDFPTARWVKAIEIRPGEKRVVHHANILLDRMQSSRSQEKRPGDGFPGMELRIESETFDPDSHIFFWKPGSLPHVEPEDMALRLEPGNDLVLNTHLQPSGKPESVEPSIGLYFTDKAATKFPVLLELQNDKALDIPPGDSHFQVTDEFTMPVDVDLLAIYPHAHYLGKDLVATATRPDGNKQTLIHIPRWDLNWQAVFYYAEQVFLPKGTMVEMRYIYDNSPANIANPFRPPQRVEGGNRTTDEMAHLWLQVLPREDLTIDGDPRKSLEEAIARHDVTRDPRDFPAQYNLGAMLQARGETQKALEHYQAAAALRPTDAIANNALGGALLSLGQAGEAISPLLLAIKGKANYFAANYNLGNAYASLGQFDQALLYFQEAARLKPDDSMAEANLGAALAEMGQLDQSKTHLERALKLDPKNSIAHGNLEEVQRRLAEKPNQ